MNTLSLENPTRKLVESTPPTLSLPTAANRRTTTLGGKVTGKEHSRAMFLHSDGLEPSLAGTAQLFSCSHHIQLGIHHHHVPEGLGMLSCSLILKMKLVPPSLPMSSYVSSSFRLYCSACFGSLFVSILCTCCSHFSWHCFISFTMFCAPVFCLIH